jgi:hypothetical protein
MRGWPWWIAGLVAIGVIAATALRGSHARRSVSLAGASILAATVLLLVNGRIPYVRVWLYLLPLVFIATGGGLAHLWRRLARAVTPLQRPLVGRAVLIALLVLIAAGGALGVVRSRVVWTADDTGAFPAAREAANVLLAQARPGDRVVATAPTDLPLEYYLAPAGARGHALLRANPDSSRRIWIVVNEAEGQDVNVLLRRAEIMTIDFSPPRAAWRGDDALIFAIDRERPGCRLAPERCR